MKKSGCLTFFLAALAAGILYCVVLWEPFGGWILTDVAGPLISESAWMSNGGIGFVGGMFSIVLILGLSIFLFILPFLLALIIAFSIFLAKNEKTHLPGPPFSPPY